MVILVIGNGFDRALGLPTNYVDFLKFAKYMNDFSLSEKHNTHDEISESGINSRICDLIIKKSGNVHENLFEKREWIAEQCSNNIWLKYFWKKQDTLSQNGQDRWVDFEAEISKIVSLIEKYLPANTDSLDTIMAPDLVRFFADFYDINSSNLKTYRELHGQLLDDLNRVISLMNYYFMEYVEELKVSKLPIVLSKELQNEQVKILSFNYTDFAGRLIKAQNKQCTVDYIHGTVASGQAENNLVLGAEIGDGLVEFADFRKYFQRILKNTDHSYVEWINNINQSIGLSIQSNKHVGRTSSNKVIFFGHSLDITDGDIIEKLIMAKHTKVIVYCYAKDKNDHVDMIQKIKNVEHIIGRDELIRMTGIDNSLTFKTINNE